MATVTSVLAWSLPVPIEILAAHLQAHINLRARTGSIHNLRLCHRFGKGPEAIITKLPVELRLEVESYLIESERATQRVKIQGQLRCFEYRCVPCDHFSDKEQLDMYLECFGDCSCCDHEACNVSKDQRQLTTQQKQKLNDVIAEYDDEGPGPLHEENVSSWETKIAPDGAGSTSSLHAQSELFLKHFGLEIFCAETQSKTGTPGQMKTNGIYRSAQSHLMLPCSKMRGTTLRPHDPYDGFDDNSPLFPAAGAMCEVALDVPRPLNNSEVARFARACRILDIIPGDDSPPPTMPQTTEEVDLAESEVNEGFNDVKPDAASYAPKLRMLVRTVLDAEGDGW